MMNDHSYIPVSCDLHSQYELAIMHKNKLKLTYKDNSTLLKGVFLPLDVITKDKAEYLIAMTSENKKIQLRLDYISEMKVLSSS